MSEAVTISLHYSRAGRRLSSLGKSASVFALATLGLVAALPVQAQYPVPVSKTDKEAPVLRAVGVLEWTGEAGKPKTSRLVPITVFDGQQLQDGGIYLARPQPLAVQGGVEYILQKDGAKIGLFDIQNAGQEQGSWVGFGTWKAMPSASPKPSTGMAAQKVDDEGSDRPTLHRKGHSVDTSSGSSGSNTGAQAPPADPDRPTLHKTSSDDSGGASSGSTPTPDGSKPAPTGTSSSGSSATDPDRPTLKKGKPKPQAETGYVESLSTNVDPNRPKLTRGKSDGGVGPVATPTLMGLPPDMKQMVAVSDPRNKPEHPWDYSWANPADELKMKAELEDIARTALGLKKPAAPAAKSRTASAKVKRAAALEQPAALVDEQFRVFELAYGSGATLVLTARTDGPPEKQKFVTLIAQPDLYGNLLVLFKSVADGAHLDDTPRMRLIDAVDAQADNRGELLFELRGETQRQFALYRVMRGAAERLFVTGGGYLAAGR